MVSSLNPGSLTAALLGGLAPHNATVTTLSFYPLTYLSPRPPPRHQAGPQLPVARMAW